MLPVLASSRSKRVKGRGWLAIGKERRKDGKGGLGVKVDKDWLGEAEYSHVWSESVCVVLGKALLKEWL